MLNSEKALVESIRKELDRAGYKYNYFEHQPVTTSQEAAQVRGVSLDQGAKALIVEGQKTDQRYMIVLPGHLKLDNKKVAQHLGERTSFLKPDIIKQDYGLMVGGIPPFGYLLNLELLVDKRILNHGEVSFNCGAKTASITMKSKDLVEILEKNKAIIGSWGKE